MNFRIAVFMMLFGLVAACQAEPEGWSRVAAPELTQEISSKETSLTVVDVREPELFQAGHIPGAINMPYPAAKKDILTALKPDQNIVFVCHGGPMGAELAAILAAKGYPNVRNLQGGMRSWSGALEQ